MYFPGTYAQNEIDQLAKLILNSNEFKKEMSNYIRLEIQNSDRSKPRSDRNVMSYDMITRGSVNMQAKMAASGYDVYGRTILKSNETIPNGNETMYKKMKNKIRYNNPQNYQNKGERKMI